MAARGDMKVETVAFGGGAEILNRPPYEAVAMTIDFSSATGESDGFKKDAGSGELFLPAGMPVDNFGKPVKEAPFANVVGILLYDVYAHRPQGAILTKAYVNVKRAQANSNVTYDAKLVAALVNAGCRIRFEEKSGNDILPGTIPDSVGE